VNAGEHPHRDAVQVREGLFGEDHVGHDIYSINAVDKYVK
jgi:hypothetical protein